VGKIEFDGEIEAVTGEPWAYRNRVQLHIQDGAIGYFEHGSHKLCAIDQCPIVSPALNGAIAKLQGNLGRLSATVELFTNETDMQVNVLDRVPQSIYRYLNRSGPVRRSNMMDSSSAGNSFLSSESIFGPTAGGLRDWRSRRAFAVDLYAGVGLFAARLAERFQKVAAVESSSSAFRDLEHNVQHVTAENKTSEEYLTTLQEKPDLILADPPRAGLGKHAVRELARIHAPRLIIVSCDPATLARDLQGLLATGYRIDKITMVDLFPQTFHIETVVHLVELGLASRRLAPLLLRAECVYHCPAPLRISSSVRFSRIASASRPGHNRSVDASERPAASKTCLGAGLKRPPVNSEMDRSRNWLEP